MTRAKLFLGVMAAALSAMLLIGCGEDEGGITYITADASFVCGDGEIWVDNRHPETGFVTVRDSVYVAAKSESGWVVERGIGRYTESDIIFIDSAWLNPFLRSIENPSLIEKNTRFNSLIVIPPSNKNNIVARIGHQGNHYDVSVVKQKNQTIIWTEMTNNNSDNKGGGQENNVIGLYFNFAQGEGRYYERGTVYDVVRCEGSYYATRLSGDLYIAGGDVVQKGQIDQLMQLNGFAFVMDIPYKMASPCDGGSSGSTGGTEFFYNAKTNEGYYFGSDWTYHVAKCGTTYYAYLPWNMSNFTENMAMTLYGMERTNATLNMTYRNSETPPSNCTPSDGSDNNNNNNNNNTGTGVYFDDTQAGADGDAWIYCDTDGFCRGYVFKSNGKMDILYKYEGVWYNSGSFASGKYNLEEKNDNQYVNITETWKMDGKVTTDYMHSGRYALSEDESEIASYYETTSRGTETFEKQDAPATVALTDREMALAIIAKVKSTPMNDVSNNNNNTTRPPSITNNSGEAWVYCEGDICTGYSFKSGGKMDIMLKYNNRWYYGWGDLEGSYRQSGADGIELTEVWNIPGKTSETFQYNGTYTLSGNTLTIGSVAYVKESGIKTDNSTSSILTVLMTITRSGGGIGGDAIITPPPVGGEFTNGDSDAWFSCNQDRIATEEYCYGTGRAFRDGTYYEIRSDAEINEWYRTDGGTYTKNGNNGLTVTTDNGYGITETKTSSYSVLNNMLILAYESGSVDILTKKTGLTIRKGVNRTPLGGDLTTGENEAWVNCSGSSGNERCYENYAFRGDNIYTVVNRDEIWYIYEIGTYKITNDTSITVTYNEENSHLGENGSSSGVYSVVGDSLNIRYYYEDREAHGDYKKRTGLKLYPSSEFFKCRAKVDRKEADSIEGCLIEMGL